MRDFLSETSGTYTYSVGNYTSVIQKPCLICKQVKQINTIIPYGSQYNPEYLCGDCFAQYVDQVLGRALLDDTLMCPICGTPEKDHEMVSQCPTLAERGTSSSTKGYSYG